MRTISSALTSLRLLTCRSYVTSSFSHVRLDPYPTLRTISTTSRLLASESPSSPFDPSSDPVLKGVIDKVANHAGARAAMEKIEKLMREKGIDMTKPPSTMTMMKLGMDKEIREAGMQLIEAFKDAGVEITPQNAAALMGKFKL